MKKVADQLTTHFRRSEFTCKCGCGRNEIVFPLVSLCETIRLALDEPITVTSGYRCPDHPVEKAKPQSGFHVKGLAADLACKSGWRKLYAVASRLMEQQADCDVSGIAPVGITGLGIYPQEGFIHVDVRPLKPGGVRATWGRWNGQYIGLAECFDRVSRGRVA